MITLKGIDQAISSLNFSNHNALKPRLVDLIRQSYTDESSVESKASIDTDELVKILWDTGSDYDSIKSRRKNFNSVKSSLNADLKKLYQQGKNPEGITIGPDNTFIMSEEAKDRILEKYGFDMGPDGSLSLDQMMKMLKMVDENLSDSMLTQDTDSTDGLKELNQLKDQLQGLSEKIDLAGSGAIQTDSESTRAQLADGSTKDADFKDGTEHSQKSGPEDDIGSFGSGEGVAKQDFQAGTADEDDSADDAAMDAGGQDFGPPAETEPPDARQAGGTEYVEGVDDLAEEEDVAEVEEGDDLEESETFETLEEVDEAAATAEALEEDEVAEGKDSLQDGVMDEGSDKPGTKDEIGEVDNLGENDVLEDVEETDDIEEDEEVIDDVEEIDDLAEEEDVEDFEETDDLAEEEAVEDLEETDDLADDDVVEDVEEADELVDDEVVENLEEVDDLADDEVVEDVEEADELVDDEVVEDLEEVDDLADDDVVEDLEEVDELSDDEVVEDVEEADELADDEVVEDVEEVDELVDDEVVEDVEEADELVDDEVVEDLEEVDELVDDEVVEDLEEVDDLEEDETLEDAADSEEDIEAELADDVGLPAGSLGQECSEEVSDKIKKARLLAEEFDGYLGAMDRYFNQYLLIPEGEYIVGSRQPRNGEKFVKKVSLAPFYMGRFPITNGLFEIFAEKTGYKTYAEKVGYGTVYYGRIQKKKDESTGLITSTWNSSLHCETVEGACWYQPSGPGSTLHNKRAHPAVQITIEDAMAFAAWTGKRLPTEEEWEAASRTSNGWTYPWGQEWQKDSCNLEDSSIGDTAPVDRYVEFENDLGIADTMGNVLEWTLYNLEAVSDKENRSKYYVAKGGSWISGNDVALFNCFKLESESHSNILGFRCVAY